MWVWKGRKWVPVEIYSLVNSLKLLKFFPMKGEKKERWLELCEQATTEQDPVKLLTLITEINRLLIEKEERLVKERTQGQSK